MEPSPLSDTLERNIIGSNSALAIVNGSPSYPRIKGTVQFRQTLNGVQVKADISGLPSTATGFFAFHMHEGNCNPPPMPRSSEITDFFPNTGGHYNPTNMPHPKHAGDFPPLLSLKDGSAHLSFVTDRFTVRQALGRSVIIHLNPDDFKTQPSGDAGMKIACGDIRPQRP